ncbi:MAG TPA: lyase [Acidimicrobiia bacterium]|nr:lyase [Acidimicrobiia bacterium]
MSRRPAAFAIAALILGGCGGTTADDPTTSITGTSAVDTTTPIAATTTVALVTTVDGTVDTIPPSGLVIESYLVPEGSAPHDVAPAADGGVWYTAQHSGELGWLDPVTGETRHVPLGDGSRPHGVIVGPDGAPWITDGGLNAIVRVDPATDEVTVFPLPEDRPEANLNTAVFGSDGRLWFTGQAGIIGVFDPATGEIEVYDSPQGGGPYGITATPDGEVYYASLGSSFVGRVAPDGEVTVIEPPTPEQGARRVWSDSEGSIWVSEWNSGQLSRYTPATGEWSAWPLPGEDPAAYAVFVDDTDVVWVSDFGANAIHRFDPATGTFHTLPLPSTPGNVRQIHGRIGEVWAAESAADRLIVIRTGP